MTVSVMGPRDFGEAMELTQLVEDHKHLERGARGINLGRLYMITTTFLFRFREI